MMIQTISNPYSRGIIKLRETTLFAAMIVFAGTFTASAAEDPLQFIDYEIEGQFPQEPENWVIMD